MKKVIALIAVCLTVVWVGCGVSQTQEESGSQSTQTTQSSSQSSVHEHVFGEWFDVGETHQRFCQIDGCEIKQIVNHDFGEFKEDNGRFVFAKDCEKCGKEVLIAQTVDNTYEAQNAIDNYAFDDVIYLNEGEYSTITITSRMQNVLIAGAEGAVVENIKFTGAEINNVTFYNVHFSVAESSAKGGIDFSDNAEATGLTFYECSFTGNANIEASSTCFIKDLRVQKCKFNVNDSNKSLPDQGIEAIEVRQLENVEITDCIFEYVQYNVVQFGTEGRLDGRVCIKNNEFLDCGSRMLYFVNPQVITECDISGNYFGDNTDCAKTGYYVRVKTGRGIVIGANEWENIPENTSENFNSESGENDFEYDITAQSKRVE